jgi:transcriptional regulator with XRE-family HTH domain
MRAAEALAKGLKRLRRRLGVTQAELAEAANVHVQFVSQVERQQRSPSLETIDALAAALDTTAAGLLAEGEDDEEARPPAPETRVAQLLAAWPEPDQKRLVKLLTELRLMAARVSRDP